MGKTKEAKIKEATEPKNKEAKKPKTKISYTNVFIYL